MSKYTLTGNIHSCRFNDKGFIYRLIELDHAIPDFNCMDVKWDADINDGDTCYIGMTSNPVRRADAHRMIKDNKNLAMQIIDSAGCPDEAQYKERKLIWEFKQKNGDVPKYNCSTWSGA